MDTNNLNLLGMIGLVGAVMMICGTFMTWIGKPLYLSGWDFFIKWTEILKIKNTFLPVLDVILGAVIFALMILPTFCNKDHFRKLNIIFGLTTAVLAAALLILSVLFMVKEITVMFFPIRIIDYLDIGFWMTFAGTVAVLIGGFMPLAKNRRRDSI